MSADCLLLKLSHTMPRYLLIIPFPVQWEEMQVLHLGQDKPLGQQGLRPTCLPSRPAEGFVLGAERETTARAYGHQRWTALGEV